MKIGVIGDDFTGSSDIALTLAQAGMQTVQYVRTPDTDAQANVQAAVISLKSRSCPVDEAVALSLAALNWLRSQGCEQFVFKYCSTFDSTRTGNIGPVIDALTKALDSSAPVIVCPAFPATGRTIYQGHLYVFDRLLSESGMQNHPITPMTDPDIRRWLQHQTSQGIGHLPLNILREGNACDHLLNEAENGRQYVVCDAVADDDLIQLAKAARDFPLITGGSGIAIGLPAMFGISDSQTALWHGQAGRSIALSGSCSAATLSQIQAHQESGGAHLPLSITEILQSTITAQAVITWALEQTALPLISTSDNPDKVKALQQTHGTERTAKAIEDFFAQLAILASNSGFTRIISAGGETSGAVVQALNMDALEIGPMIDPGVPALKVTGKPLAIALKSGNFGAPDFFAKADRILSASS